MEHRGWLPLSGKLLARDGGGIGDEADPVEMPPLVKEYVKTLQGSEDAVSDLATERVDLLWLGEDWDAKQAWVQVKGPQQFFDWLRDTCGLSLAAGTPKLPRDGCRSFLARFGRGELDDRSPERVELLRRKRSDDTIGLLEQEELLLLESV